MCCLGLESAVVGMRIKLSDAFLTVVLDIERERLVLEVPTGRGVEEFILHRHQGLLSLVTCTVAEVGCLVHVEPDAVEPDEFLLELSQLVAPPCTGVRV